MPTTTRSAIFGGKHVERIAPPGEVVIDALLHERRAMLGFARLELLNAQPVQLHDLLVERPALLNPEHLPAEAKAQERNVLRRVAPAVDSNERARREPVRGLLKRLTRARRDKRFARIEV